MVKKIDSEESVDSGELTFLIYFSALCKPLHEYGFITGLRDLVEPLVIRSFSSSSHQYH